ncbi:MULTISPECIES: metallophosphoesterase family protein [Bacillaceae]|uniref:Calcineurin-like phosphoesterase domain-containing protein n=1 Tax=Alkalicoccobacillus plakortidis TaxID=444060 RepID=A0A9D5I103_9BACI|nr:MULTISPECIES: metallophosphoesterase [Bacillaceae]KQL57112.1 hypothetical protein AN965_10595 [Alkalicoccobacillus plakortidis]
MYKLTEDNGNRKYLTNSGIDIFTLAAGFYESTGDKLINTPWKDGGFVTIDVFQNTSGSGTRKQFILNYSYMKRIFVGNLHTNGSFRGWVELKHNEGVSAFLEDELFNLYEKVATIQNTNTKSFGFISDTHYIRNSNGSYGMNGLQHVNNIIDFTKYGLLDFVVHGGDIINGKDSPSVYKRELYDNVKAFMKSKVPVAILKGNHDYGPWYTDNTANPKLADIMSPTEWHQKMVKPFEENFVFNSAEKNGGYYYKDFDDMKLRVIFLNTADVAHISNNNGSPKYHNISFHALRNRQIQWLAHTALNFQNKQSPSNWTVVTMSHVPITGSDGVGKATNAFAFRGIIRAFKLGIRYRSAVTEGDHGVDVTVDFTGRKGNHIAHIGGHYHLDEDYVHDEIRYINVLHSATADSSTGLTRDPRPRDSGEITEDSWNVFTVNTSNRRMHLSRFGQGSDKVISY